MGTCDAATAAAPSWLASWVPFPAERAGGTGRASAVDGGGHQGRRARAPGRAEASVEGAGCSLTREPPATAQEEDERDAERGGDVATDVVLAAEVVAGAGRRGGRSDVGEIGAGERGGGAGRVVPWHHRGADRGASGACEAADHEDEEEGPEAHLSSLTDEVGDEPSRPPPHRRFRAGFPRRD